MPADDGVADAPVGRWARLKHAVSRRRGAAEVPAEATDSPARRTPTAVDPAEATADEAPPKRSLLTRFKSLFRRHAAAELLEAGADPSLSRDTAPNREHAADSDESPVQPGRMRRALAMLSRKRVWIPAMSLALLGMMGAMLILLLQSAQEKERLQTELLAAQQQLDQAGGAKKAVPKNDVAEADTTAPVDEPAAPSLGAVAAVKPDFDPSGCEVSDKESVSQNLRHCIDAFNRSMTGARTVRTAP